MCNRRVLWTIAWFTSLSALALIWRASLEAKDAVYVGLEWPDRRY